MGRNGTGWVTTTEAAQRLGVSARTIRRWIDEGHLNAERITSRLTMIEEASIAAHEQRTERIRSYGKGKQQP